MSERSGKVLALLLGRIERIEVVEADHPVAPGQESLDQVAADESGGAGDEDRFTDHPIIAR
ncbi:hypothetical protein D3C83_241240 [compost metagenome]